MVKVSVAQTGSKENVTVVAGHQNKMVGRQHANGILPDHPQGIPDAVIHFSARCRAVHEAEIRKPMPKKNRSRLLYYLLKLVWLLEKIVMDPVILHLLSRDQFGGTHDRQV